MKKLTTALLSLICFSLVSYAQRNRDIYDREITASAGVYASFLENSGSDLALGISYGQFNHNGLGYTAGFQYISSVANVNDVLGFPLAIAFKGRSRSGSERLESAAGSAARSARSNGGDNRNTLANAFLGLFNQTQIYAGVTPGYIIGQSSGITRTPAGSAGTWRQYWMETETSLYFSLDAGIAWNLSIWRFDLRLQPAVHYWLTKSLTAHSAYVDALQNTYDSSKPVRWFFSMSAGLSFRF